MLLIISKVTKPQNPTTCIVFVFISLKGLFLHQRRKEKHFGAEESSRSAEAGRYIYRQKKDGSFLKPLIALSCSKAALITLRLVLSLFLSLLYLPVCSSHLQLFGRHRGTAECLDIFNFNWPSPVDCNKKENAFFCVCVCLFVLFLRYSTSVSYYSTLIARLLSSWKMLFCFLFYFL